MPINTKFFTDMMKGEGNFKRSKLRFWNSLIAEAKEKQVDIDYVFILASKKVELEDINMELDITDLQSSIYVDTAFVFQKVNSMIPVDLGYHSFLLDGDFNVVLVGSPIENEKVLDVYKNKVNV